MIQQLRHQDMLDAVPDREYLEQMVDACSAGLMMDGERIQAQ